MGYIHIILFSIASWWVGGMTGAMVDDLMAYPENFNLSTAGMIVLLICLVFFYFRHLEERGLPSKKWGIWAFVILGALVLYSFNDFAEIFEALSLWVDAWLLYRTLPGKGVKPDTAQPNPFEAAPNAVGSVQKPNKWAGMDFGEISRQAIACAGSRGDLEFQSLLQKTADRSDDLIIRDVRVPEALREHYRKLLITYLEMNDDTNQIRETDELRDRLRSGFETIYQTLGNFQDKTVARNRKKREAEMQTLEMKLRQDGLLDFDFELSEE